MNYPLYTTATTATPPRSPLPQSPRKRHVILKHTTNKQPITDPTISWTSSISHRCRNGRLPDAIAEFTRMRLAGVEPNYITFVSLLSACADSESSYLGPPLHAYVCKLGLDRNNVKVGTAISGMYSKCGCIDLARLSFDGILQRNIVSWNTMLDGYVKNGFIEDAISLFDEMPQRDAVSWTVMLGGFSKQGEFEQALELFKQMQISGVDPDYVTVVSVISACANLGALGLGLWIHRLVLDRGFEDNIRINNSLIDMYSRCGCIGFARRVFENMKCRTVVSWNSMIVGFAVNGYAEKVLELFNSMLNLGFEPDGVTFTGAIAACSHVGLVDEGLNLFDKMTKVHKVSPRIEHYGCIVDLYSRAGRLEDALNVIESMPMKPNEIILGSLLAACTTHVDVNLANKLMEYLFELDPQTDSNYVLLSNIYAAVGSWDGANSVRKKMKDMGIQKKPGISSVEVDCNVHVFVAGDKSHIDTAHIYGMLELLHIDLGVQSWFPSSYIEESYDFS